MESCTRRLHVLCNHVGNIPSAKVSSIGQRLPPCTVASGEADAKAATAREAAGILGTATDAQRKHVLACLREELTAREPELLEANAADVAAAKAAGDDVARLALNGKIRPLLEGLQTVHDLADPLGQVTLARTLADGLNLYRCTVPIGVLLVIFEARPEAAVQIFGLAIKTGNAVLLKGGTEAQRSLAALLPAMRAALESAGLPETCVQLVSSREDVHALLSCERDIDLVIPRGSNQLVRSIQNATRIPVLGHADGVCHLYIDAAADIEMALSVLRDAKTTYPAACNAVETVLVHSSIASKVLPRVSDELPDVVLKADARSLAFLGPRAEQAKAEDFGNEWGNLTLSVATVDSLDEAVKHITRYGSRHTEVIITKDTQTANAFVDRVDAAGVYINASSRFADGFRYGFGAEVGISTSRLHARGPVGLEGLLSYKYRMYGNGHVVSQTTFDHRPITGVSTTADIQAMDAGAAARKHLASARRILIKVGSGVVTRSRGGGVALGRIAHVVEQVAQLVHTGREVVLISSGGVATGRRVLFEANTRPQREGGPELLPIPSDELPPLRRAAYSAVSEEGRVRQESAAGQSQLMALYEHLFSVYSTHIAQLLISLPDLKYTGPRKKTSATIESLMRQGVVPIVNENDAIGYEAAVGDGSIDDEELQITDNDSIAACLAAELRCDLVLLLSDVEGVKVSPNAERPLSVLTERMILDGAVTFGSKSSVGRGGMEAKLRAARYCARRGIPVVVANGTTNRQVRTILDVVRGAQTGTLIQG